MTFNPRCLVCQHPARIEIEQSIQNGTSYAKIVEIAKSKFPDRHLGRWNLSTHTHHMAVNQQTVQINPYPVTERAFPNSTPVPTDPIDVAKLDKMPEPSVVGIIDRELNKLELITASGKELTPEQELKKRHYIQFKLTAETNQIAKAAQVVDTEKVDWALKRLKEIEDENRATTTEST